MSCGNGRECRAKGDVSPVRLVIQKPPTQGPKHPY